MHSNFISLVAVKALLLLFIIPSTVFSQIKITSPTPRAVYQRDVTGQREISVSGSFTIPIDKIEVRAVPVVVGQGIESAWKDLQVAPKGGVFMGSINLYAGWYTLEVRATTAGQVVGRDVVERLGVGEVFIISGQSNAQGLKAYPGPDATDDRVIYISNYNNDPDPGQGQKDVLTDPPAPLFTKLAGDVKIMSPRGQTAWCWGILGDLLVKHLNVPVLFINTAWEGTAIENWASSAQGLPTYNHYGGLKYAPEMPYGNLRISVKNLAHQYGARAILWMQGETDGLINTSATEYRQGLQTIIDRLASDTGKRIVWVIARTSRTSPNDSKVSFTRPSVIAGQNAVIDTKFNPTYPGPETDGLVPNRPDGTHFTGTENLTILANAWFERLDGGFFATSTPTVPVLTPAIAAACTPENNAVTITLPAGYSSYSWYKDGNHLSPIGSGTSIRVTAAGSYRATVKDASGNSSLSPTVILDGPAKPNRPTITPSGAQQACADTGFVFSSPGGTDIYSWYKEGGTTVIASGATARLKETGNYTLKGQNIFGCVSDNSAVAALTVRPEIPKPVIEQSGPFSLKVSIPTTGLNEKYDWKRDAELLTSTSNIIKVTQSGSYTSRAKVVYTLGSNSLTCYSPFSDARKFETSTEDNDVVIYPNPSLNGYLYIESRDDIKGAEIVLYDIFGRVLTSKSIPLLNTQVPIDVRNMASGSYILQLKGDGIKVTKKVVIQ